MKIFTYRVKSEMGKITEGEMRAESAEALKTLLKEKGYTPYDVQEKKWAIDLKFLNPRIGVKDLSMFCRQFTIILQAGVPIATALDVLRNQSTNPTLRKVLNDIYEGMQKGISLSNCMKQHKKVFPELLINMVEAGEISGQLEAVFSRMADTYEKETKLNRKIKASLTYPIIVSIVATLVIAVLMIKVVPDFVQILDDFNVDLPPITVMLIWVSDFLVDNLFRIVAVIVAVYFAMKSVMKTRDGKYFFHNLLLKIPVIGSLTVKIVTARFARTLSVLLASGVLLIQSMEVVQKIIGNTVVKGKIEAVTEDIKKGKGLYAPLHKTNFFPPMVTSMVRIGEESGELDFSLDKCADFYDDEVETGLQQATSLIEPIVMIGMAIIVGFIVLSILLPMLSIYENIENM